MKKFNTAIITLAAVMSMSASAMAAPLCTNTLSNSLQSCKLSTSVLACNSGSTNCDINSILNSNCSSDVKGNLQFFTKLGLPSCTANTTGTNCNSNATNCKATATDATASKDTNKTTTTTSTTPTKVTKPSTTATTNTTPSKATTPSATPSKTTTAATTTTKTTTNTTPSNASVSAYAQEVVNLVNAERAKEGLSPLSIDSKVTAAAQVRATEIKTSFSHTRPDGRSCFTALAEAGASYSGAGENIAIGQKTPSEVVTAWMNSPGHRANIMKPNFKYIGIGINGTAWAQLFTY